MAETRKNQRINPIIMALVFVTAVITALPMLLVIGVGMMPTWAAIWIDRTKQRYAAFCVGSLNFCGVVPFLFQVWDGSHTPQAAVRILLDMFSLLTMWGSAALGWLLFLAFPPVVLVVIEFITKARIKSLQRRQEQLISTWGEKVSAPESPDPEGISQKPDR